MTMHRSLEEGFIRSMTEEDVPAARDRLTPAVMLDGYLIGFYETLARSLDLVTEEIRNRGLRT